MPRSASITSAFTAAARAGVPARGSTGWLRAAVPLATALTLTAGSAHPASGQSAPAGGAPPPTIAPFDLGTSPLALRGDVRPNVYLAAVGRRAIAVGTEDGRLELWSWPIKWAHDFQLAFRVPKYTAPIPGRDVARSVTVRPEGVTIEYAYETFTVRQHVFAALDRPAVVMLLEVDAVRPMEIVASFTPDVHYAWPASLGGQYLVWDDEARAFLFSESRRRVNAYLGSPATVQASDVPAHQLTAAPPQFVIAVGSPADRYTEPKLGEPPGKNVDLHVAYIPVVLAGGEIPRDSARALYEALLAPGAAEREWRRRVEHANSVRGRTLAVNTPDSALNRAIEWAKVNLDEALACNPDLGCGLVAGYGLSGGASDRPGFGWFFGGDAAINSLAMTAVGQSDLVREGALRFFAKYQRADGKIPHEISQGAAKIDWFGGYPYAFYHGDTTPFWILAFGEYWRQTADTALVRELWPKLKRAYAWSAATDADGDGLMENPLAGAGALEVGELQAGIVSDIYLSGVWVAALERFARMAAAMGEPALADRARAVRAKALRTLEAKLWLPTARQYAFALLERGRVNESLTAWPATAMSFGVLQPARGADMAARLASAAIMTDWGARPLAATSPLFDPLHYNNGAVWPFVTGWVALAQYRYHNAPAGRFALDAVARTGFDEARGRNPEVISGRLYKPLDTAVPHQFFATSMVLTPLVRGLLGIDVDAAAGRVTIAPHLPPEWDGAPVRVTNVPVGRERLSITLWQDSSSLRAEVSNLATDPRPIEVMFSPALPIGAEIDSGTIAVAAPGSDVALGRTVRPSAADTPGDVHATLSDTLTGALLFRLPFRGGWSVMPPRQAPSVGDRSRALRVVSEHLLSGVAQYGVALEGRAGRAYTLRLRTPLRGKGRLTLGVGGERRDPPATADRLGPPEAAGWRELRVTFPRDGADADGYVRVVLYATELAP